MGGDRYVTVIHSGKVILTYTAGLLNPDGSLTDHGKRDVKTREEGAGTLIVAAFDPAVGSKLSDE